MDGARQREQGRHGCPWGVGACALLGRLQMGVAVRVRGGREGWSKSMGEDLFVQNDGKPYKKADTGQKRISWLRGRKGKFDRFSTHPAHICPHQLTNKPHPDISANPPTLTATDVTTFTDKSTPVYNIRYKLY